MLNFGSLGLHMSQVILKNLHYLLIFSSIFGLPECQKMTGSKLEIISVVKSTQQYLGEFEKNQQRIWVRNGRWKWKRYFFHDLRFNMTFGKH